MTTVCQLCGKVIRVETAAMILNPGTDPLTAAAIAEISLFDRLAGRMSQHLEEHEKQNMEMIAVMHLAAKVYAMTWAESPTEEPDYSKNREAWRTGIFEMLKTTSNPVSVYDADAAAAAPGSSSDAPPVGSNEKKSVRNASN